MAELAKILGVGIVTAITAVLLRTSRPELSFAVTIAGSVILLLFSIDLIGQTFGVLNEIGEKTGIDNQLIKLIVKIVAIGYLVEFAAGIVEDFGSKSIADKLADGNLPLEELIKLYEEGAKLAAKCREMLEGYKARLDVIEKQNAESEDE